MKKRKTPFILISAAVTLTLLVVIINAASIASFTTPPPQGGGDGKTPTVAGDPRTSPPKEKLMQDVMSPARQKPKELNFDEPLILKPGSQRNNKLTPAENLPTPRWWIKKG